MDHQLAYEIATHFLGPMAERAEKYIAVTLQSLGNLLVENFDLPSGQDGFEGSKPVVKNFWYYTMQKAMLARINRMADNGEIEKLLMLSDDEFSTLLEGLQASDNEEIETEVQDKEEEATEVAVGVKLDEMGEEFDTFGAKGEVSNEPEDAKGEKGSEEEYPVSKLDSKLPKVVKIKSSTAATPISIMRNLLLHNIYAKLSDPPCWLVSKPGKLLPYDEKHHKVVKKVVLKGQKGREQPGEPVMVVYPGVHFNNPIEGCEPTLKSLVIRMPGVNIQRQNDCEEVDEDAPTGGKGHSQGEVVMNTEAKRAW